MNATYNLEPRWDPKVAQASGRGQANGRLPASGKNPTRGLATLAEPCRLCQEVPIHNQLHGGHIKDQIREGKM